MYKPITTCPKCGGLMTFHLEKGEKTSGMDIEPLKPTGVRNTCIVCRYDEFDSENNKMLAQKIN